MLEERDVRGLAEDKLDHFVDRIIGEAAQKKAHMLDAFDLEKNKQLEVCEKETFLQAYNLIQSEIIKIRRDADFTVHAWKSQLTKKLLKEREKMFADVINGVALKLKEFSSTADYAQLMQTHIQNGLKLVAGAAEEVWIMPKDMELFGTFNLKNAVLKTLNKDVLGGFILKNLTIGVVIDCTFQSGLERQRGYFLENSGLTIEN